MTLPPLASDPNVPEESLTVSVPSPLLSELVSRADRLGWTVPELARLILLGEFPARRRFPILGLDAAPEAVEVIERAGYALPHALDWHAGGWVSREAAPFPGSALVSRFAFVTGAGQRIVEVETAFGQKLGQEIGPYTTRVALVLETP